MDTTKEYRNQCEKAKKYLGIPETPGSFWYDTQQKKVFVVDDMGITHKVNEKYIVPLYRQDQLQKIWQDEFNNGPFTGMIDEFYDWVRNLSPYNNPDYLEWSMEQLWLAFVMKEKYSKTWNGKDWVCIK